MLTKRRATIDTLRAGDPGVRAAAARLHFSCVKDNHRTANDVQA